MSRMRLLLGINIFWLALSALFDGLNSIVLPAHLLTILGDGRAATTLGLITFAGLLAAMLIQPLAGYFSDRTRHRWGRRGQLSIGVLVVIAGLALFAFARSLLLVFAAYLLIQLAASITQAAQQGFIPDLAPRRWRGAASGVKGLMDLGGAFLAFAALGALVQKGGTPLAVIALAAILLATFVLTLALVRESPAPPSQELTPAQRWSLIRAFHFDVQQHSAFAWLVVSRFLFLLGVYTVGRFLLLFVAVRLNLTPDRAAEEAGLLLALLSLVTLLAAVPAGWLADRVGRVPLMVAGGLLSAAGALPLIWAGSRLEIALFGSLMGLGSAAFASANWALTADLAPKAEAARFFGLANFGTGGAAAVAGLFGPLVDTAGFPPLFMVATASFLASIVVLRFVAARHSDHRPHVIIGHQEIIPNHSSDIGGTK